MKNNDDFCFDCYDNMMFQMIGQTEEWKNTNYSKKYLETYKKEFEQGIPIECCICGDRIKYIQQENGKWKGELVQL